MKQPPIKTKELSGDTVQIADGQNWEIASITAYGETPQGGTTEAPVALTGVDSVQVCGRNLLSYVQTSGTTNGITKTVNADNSITLSGTATSRVVVYLERPSSHNILSRGTYTLSIGAQIPTECSALLGQYNGDKYTGNVVYIPAGSSSATFTLNKKSDALSGHIDISSGTTVDLTIYPMLNLGSTAMPYEPYQGSVTTLPIPRPLRRVGDVRDVCVTRQAYESAEKLVVTYNVGFVELDGTEDVVFHDYGNSKRLFLDLNSSASGELALEFSHGETSTAPTVPGGLAASFNEANLYRLQILGAPDTWTTLGVTDTATAKAWLAAQKSAGTPVQIAYQLATAEVYATDPVDFDNAAGPLTVMSGGEVEVALAHRMLTPYTVWAIRYDSEGEYTGDFFNVEDYDRIKQNIEYLREYAYFLYGGFTMRSMVDVTVESYGYASTIDALDANLEAIAANTFRPPDMLPVKQWRGNQPPPGPDDWNRIENTCLLLFEQFERQFACLPKLAFELKGSAF